MGGGGKRDIWVRFFLCRDKPELKTNLKECERDREWARAHQKDKNDKTISLI